MKVKVPYEPSTSKLPRQHPVPVPAGGGFFFRVQLPESKQLGNNVPAIEKQAGCPRRRDHIR